MRGLVGDVTRWGGRLALAVALAPLAADAQALLPATAVTAPATGQAAAAGATAAPVQSGGADRAATARALFYGGDSAVLVGVAGMAPSLPAQRFPCANCHGPDGMGGAEGARDVPPIVPVGRAALTPAAILAALADGTGANGRKLDPLMPRYRIDAGDAGALADFLAVLPAQERRGVGPGTLSLRLASPPAAEPLAKAFAAGFVQALGDRSVWGRRILLVNEDTPAFAALGFGADDPDLPLVAPLGPADTEAPRRLLCASFDSEVEALLASLPADQPVRIHGDGPLADRARRIADAAGHRHADDPQTPVLLLSRVASDDAPLGGRVLGIAAHLHGPALDALVQSGRRVTLSDGCGGLAAVSAGPDAAVQRAHQLGAEAAEAVWQALVRSGRNVTRARFLAALGRVEPPLTERGPAPVIRDYPPSPVEEARQ